MEFTFVAEVWRYQGDASWFFVTLPEGVSDEIADLQQGPRRGFGAVRVRVRTGPCDWRTSIFPDTKRGSYILPVKKAVRQAAGLEDGSPAEFTLELA